jgi:polyisoprenoid-binding protein YceI
MGETDDHDDPAVGATAVDRSARVPLIIGITIVVLIAAVATYLLVFSGTDAPDELGFDDAATTSATPTTAPGATGPAPTDVAGTPGATDGTWVATDRSQAGYRVLEDRIGGLQNIEAVGRTNQVTGGFTVAGTTVSDVEFVVDVASITSDSGIRDGRFRGGIMDTAEFPDATFRAATIELGELPAEGAEVAVPVQGNLTLRGVTKPVATDLKVKRTGGEVQVLGSIPVVFADYGIATPSPPGLSVRDEGTVEFLIVAVPGT